MPSPEQGYQPRPLETPQTDHGERAPQPTTSPHMEQVVTQLAATHHIDLSQKGATLQLDVPEQKQRWLIGKIDGQRFGVTRCQVDQENGLAPDLDMVFEVKPAGWEPMEIVHAPEVWQEYASAAQTGQNTAADAQGNFSFARFSEYWAQQIEQAGGHEADNAGIGR